VLSVDLSCIFPGFLIAPTAIMSKERSSHEYAATEGSVYLITSDGRTLNLPIASNSPADPLNWCAFQRFSTIAAMSLFTIVGLVLVQGTSMFLHDLDIEYSGEVCLTKSPQ